MPADPSWVWRKLLNLRHLVQPFIRHFIGNGENTSMWYDLWHPLGPLLDKFGSRIVYDSGLPLNAKVSLIVHNAGWTFPITQTWELNEVRRHLPPLRGSRDQVRWTLNASGQFSIASLWEELRIPSPKVRWHKAVWFSGHIPKCSFITWLAIQGRLSTEDRLVLFGIKSISQCSFCLGSESHDHLFFNCSFSTRVWNAMLAKMDTSWSPKSWTAWITHFSSFRGKSLRNVVSKLIFTTTCIIFG